LSEFVFSKGAFKGHFNERKAASRFGLGSWDPLGHLLGIVGSLDVFEGFLGAYSITIG
jgi:hypothetical protein